MGEVRNHFSFYLKQVMAREKKMIFFIFCTLSVIGYIGYQVNVVKLTHVSFETSKLQKGKALKIIQISDVHGKKLTKGMENRLMQGLAKEIPDMIVLTGDLIDKGTKDFEHIYSLVERLKGITPYIYYIQGNHEWRNPGRRTFIKGLVDRKVRVLHNENTVFMKGDLAVNICGVEDYHTRHHDVKRTVKGVNKKRYTILLSHSPKITRQKEPIEADLILAGHTHGGQIRLPFIGAIVSSGDGFFPKYSKGVYQLSKGRTLYIDSGLGTRLIPIRTFNQSQVSVLTIRGVVRI
ncbi:MAG: metallophosphoesterase [Bacillota bacterium]